MLINKIQLSNFRNFKKNIFVFSPKTTVIVGPNASGKTNILESLFLFATGKSFRARIEEEMISYNSSLARAIAIVGSINQPLGTKDIIKNQNDIRNDRPTKLEVVLTRGEI